MPRKLGLVVDLAVVRANVCLVNLSMISGSCVYCSLPVAGCQMAQLTETLTRESERKLLLQRPDLDDSYGKYSHDCTVMS